MDTWDKTGPLRQSEAPGCCVSRGQRGVGYRVIEDDVDCEFRRLCTIAKGDDRCVFEFYRKGTAPDNAHLNK